MKSKPKAENLTVIKTCPTTARQRDITKKKKTPIKKSQISSNINIISNNIYNAYTISTTIKLFKLTTETPKLNKSNVHETSAEVKSLKHVKILFSSKLFHDAPFSYFPGTCVSKMFYNNLISKSRSYLIFTVRLSFYALLLGLIFRNYLLSPKLNYGFSGENATFLKISYKYTHHAKYLPLEVYILSTNNFSRIDRFRHNIALKHNFQSNHFSQPDHDNEFTFYFVKVA